MCNYCNKKQTSDEFVVRNDNLPTDSYYTGDIRIYGTKLNIDTSPWTCDGWYFDAEIKYCPMCGNKL